MIVGIVGVLCCGAQYIPLDGNVVATEALRTVVQQSQSAAILCLTSTKGRFTDLDVGGRALIAIDTVPLGTDVSLIGIISEALQLVTPDSGCYVIYTSGTTGKPKGVDVTHGNVVNLVCLSPGNLTIGPGVRVGQVLNISFDMAAWEILGCLCNGGTLVLRGSDWKKTLQDPISVQLADKWASCLAYYNCCGPTETTIVNTMHRHVAGEPLSIGRPTPNNRVYILDDRLEPVPIGVQGVVWGGGKGISKGYIGLPELTQAKYLADKFAKDGTLMYNTGDVGIWQANGTIQLLGRCDDQVKIKGFRVELDGITASLASAPAVAKAAVLLIEEELHAFVQPSAAGGLHLPTIEEAIASSLPYYARPAHYHVLDCFPLTPNGKVDKGALRQLVQDNNDSDTAESFSDASSTQCATSCAGSITSKRFKLGTSIDEEKGGLDNQVPDKSLPQPLRGLVYRILIPYRFLFSVVWLANVAALVVVCANGSRRDWLGNMVAVNLVVAVLIRQDFVINALYTIFCSVPKTWPLWIRASCAKIYHLGGVHSSAASCAGIWLLAANISDAACASLATCPNYPPQSVASMTLSWMLSALFVSMIGLASPSFRKTHHDFFERWHRFVGWTMLALFWAQNFVTIHDTARLRSVPYGSVLVSSIPFWLLVGATISIALSWCWLRRVRVISEVLSDHAVRLHFDYTVPVNGSFTRVSFRPLIEWHSFATIPAPQAHGPAHDPTQFPAGHSLLVSNAGDWTKACIKNPPTHLWVRGVPTCGVMRIATLFNRVVVVATGSGIGPCLGHIQQPSCATQVLWSTRDPEKSFGAPLINEIKEKVPGAVIWDTNELGRPDMVALSYNMAKDFGAEAVIVIANEKITKKIVYGLETRGVHAYGAIWDS
ncbi:unnamed protein product [Parascedosporium putredinis]|uniref:AMP-dependent synthetase/ligase domain-containing protein n=1 Tax=Parascedosporium putredinis TaxID=1442378 RepID=A0A9P1HBV9_9PEZI|nr:unnamed protein product [Parascedosporium putredinis]CAI8004294.1 unnamed protein product [Parascedosporium putredinis]